MHDVASKTDSLDDSNSDLQTHMDADSPDTQETADRSLSSAESSGDDFEEAKWPDDSITEGPADKGGSVEEGVQDAPCESETVEQLEKELAAARAEVDDYIDQLQRAAAEFQNSRKRQERQLVDAIDRANADLIRRLLPVLDDFDLAFQNVPIAAGTGDSEDDSADEAAEASWVSGFRQIQRKLLDLLSDHGVAVIDADGEFDPQRHEAISSEPSDDVESGHIIEVLRAGYEYKGQVLRPAMVRVAA